VDIAPFFLAFISFFFDVVTVVVWISITVASIMNIKEGGQITNPRSRRVSWLQAAPEQTAIPAREGDGVEIEAKVNHSYPSLEAPSQFFRRAAWDAAAVTTEVGDPAAVRTWAWAVIIMSGR